MIATIFDLYYWMDVTRSEEYGYYEWLELGDNYGNIFNHANNTGGDCMIIQVGIKKSYRTTNCNNYNQGLCIHRLRDRNNSFCDLYKKICGTTLECQCKAKNVRFTCQRGCENYVTPTDCAICQEKFESYPEPSIDLQFISAKGKIYITIKNSWKLAYVNDDKLVFCFTDVYQASTTKVKDRYHHEEVEEVKVIEDTVIYSITPRDLGPGTYWCEGFKYPYLTKVKSDSIIADIAGSYTANFVLNLTLNLNEDYTFLPYNLHIKATQIVDDVVGYDFKSIRPAYISPTFNEGSNVNISIHLTTSPESDTTEAYSAVNESLTVMDSQGLTIDAFTNSKICIANTIILENFEISWPEIELGQITPPIGVYLQSDGTSITRNCTGSFQTGAEWGEVIGRVSSSKEVSAITQSLIDLRDSGKSPNEMNLALKEVISGGGDDIIAYDVYIIAQIFYDIAKSGEPFDMGVYAENIEYIIGFDEDILRAAQLNLNATDTILYSLDLALIASINNNRDHNITVTITSNIYAQVVNLKANNIIGLAVYSDGNGDYLMENITRDTNLNEILDEDLVFAVFLPPNLLSQILSEQELEEEINVVTAVFFTGTLFNSQNTTHSQDGLILSMFIDKFQPVYLHEPIPIVFRSPRNKNGERYCGFWKYGIDELWVNILGSWSINNEAINNGTFQLCRFTHLTHFALLVSGVDDHVLNYISIVGCVLSIFGVAGIFATALVSKSWREGSGTKILLNYSAAILIQMIALLCSDLIDEESQRGLCIFTGIVIHYTIISQFFWMLSISYLQYRKFVQVLVQEPRNIVIKSCTFAWLTPLILIIITSASNIDTYHRDNNCYLWGLGLYLGVFLPVIGVISINAVIFVLIFKSVLYQKTQAYGVNKKLIGLKIKLAVILFFLMGFSWIFGLFAGVLKSLFLSYIFSITATIQGLVLYLYFVVCNKTTRKLWLRKINQLRSLFNPESQLVNEDTKSNSSSSDDFKVKK